MKTADAFWMFLPEGLDELFEMVRFERTEQAYDIWLDEKKKLSDDDCRNPNIVDQRIFPVGIGGYSGIKY